MEQPAPRLSRRAFLRMSSIALTGSVLAACGGTPSTKSARYSSRRAHGHR